MALALAAALVAGPASQLVQAQLPSAQLFAVSPPGGRQATVVDVSLAAGADLDGANQLHFTHPGITAAQKQSEPSPLTGAVEPLAGQFAVTIAPEVPPGVYDVRASGTFGISNPRAFVVGDLAELKEPGGNNSAEKAHPVELESIINGTADGSASDWFKFTAKAGQRVILDCWAERIDSRMDATLVVYDSAGRELARSRDSNGRDPLIDLGVAADGEYLLEVFDFVYAGGADHFYRLSIGTGPYIDFIHPPAGLPGSKGTYTIFGRNLPGSSPADVSIEGRPLERLDVEIELPADTTERVLLGSFVRPQDSSLDGIDYRLTTPRGVANPVFLGFAQAPIAAEQEPNDEPAQASQVTVPCEFVGQFGANDDHDWVRFDARQGEVYWIEIYSQRLGLPTDPYVLVQQVTVDEQGQEKTTDVAELDDESKNIGGLAYNTAHGDAGFRFQVPADGTYRMLVRDLYYTARNDPRRVYRLAIRQPQPDFRLVAVPPFPSANRTEARPWNPLLRRGGTEIFDVSAFRRDGFAGEIVITPEGLPEGVLCPPMVIAPGQDSVALTLIATEQAPDWVGTFRIIGRAKVGETELSRVARGGAVLAAAPANIAAASRMTRDLALAVGGPEPAPFLVELGENQTWEMSRAGKLQIPVKLTRRGEIKQNLTLTPLGLPPNVQPQPLALDGNTNQANFEVQINPNAPLGTFNFCLQVQTTVAYRRDVAAAERAAAAKAKIDKLAEQLAAASAAAEAARQAAEQAAAQAQTAAEQAAVAAKTAAEAATQAQQQADAEAEKAAAAKTAAENDPNNQDLANARQAAEQAAADAAAAAKTAAEAQAAAE
ncbi:MAG: PPC domain-containing protein, partial [Pirellulales bacterium]